jgi:hypothetical protein
VGALDDDGSLEDCADMDSLAFNLGVKATPDLVVGRRNYGGEGNQFSGAAHAV